MKPIHLLVTLPGLFVAGTLSAQTLILTDSGREVIVNDNGQWEFASRDQFATLPDGTRIRLKNDGSWLADETVPVMSAPAQAASGGSTLLVQVDDLVIETRRERRNKNVISTSHTVISLSFEHTGINGESFELPLTSAMLSIEDSNGKEYPVIGFTPDRIELQPGEVTNLEVRADGAPGWRLGKHYRITMSPELTGTNRETTITVPLSQARDRDLQDQ